MLVYVWDPFNSTAPKEQIRTWLRLGERIGAIHSVYADLNGKAGGLAAMDSEWE